MKQPNAHETTYTQMHANMLFPGTVVSKISSPTFDDRGDQNAILHTQFLKEYFALRPIPKTLQLALAAMSLTGPSVCPWILATSRTPKSYDDFQASFTKQLWRKTCQS
jgi:hypothetical protein